MKKGQEVLQKKIADSRFTSIISVFYPTMIRWYGPMDTGYRSISSNHSRTEQEEDAWKIDLSGYIPLILEGVEV